MSTSDATHGDYRIACTNILTHLPQCARGTQKIFLFREFHS